MELKEFIMREHYIQAFITALVLLICPALAFSLGEEQISVSYKVIHASSAGDLISYAHYSVVAYEEDSYWLQRVISMTPNSKPVSITQTLLDRETHEALRYIMHRPAKMNRPASVIDLPLERMGKDEILPLSPEGLPGLREDIRLEAGNFETLRISQGDAVLWLSADIPVLGVAKAETDVFTMELIHVSNAARDLLSKKPPKGGVVNLEDE